MASTNVPDPAESFIIPPGEQRVVWMPNERQANSGTISLNREDHTLGGSVAAHLLLDDRVLFVGYRMPHPLKHNVHICVQTTDETDPIQATCDALERLGQETALLFGQVPDYII